MDLAISSQVLITNLSSPGPVAVGEILRYDSRRVEIAVEFNLPVGAAVSIETNSWVLLGHVAARGLGNGWDSTASLSYLVLLDQSLRLEACQWPGWSAAHYDRTPHHPEAVAV